MVDIEVCRKFICYDIISGKVHEGDLLNTEIVQGAERAFGKSVRCSVQEWYVPH